MNLNFTSPLNHLGYGLAGTNIAVQLKKLGVNLALWEIGPRELSPSHWETLRPAFDEQQFFDPSAPSVRLYHQFNLAQHIGKYLHCGFPIFELDRFRPVELHHLKVQDRLLVTSGWAKSVLEASGFERDWVYIVPLGVDPEVFVPDERYVVVNHSGPTVFMNIGKWEYRKGHDVLIDAFNQAFEPNDNVRLVMHCHNPCFQDPQRGRDYSAQWERYCRLSKMCDKILLTDGRLPDSRAVAALIATADCGVFPSRAEGWNLEAGEFLAMGKQLIVTNCSAHTEFCNSENSKLIDCDQMEEAHDGIWFRADAPDWQGKPGKWASLGQPQVDQLVAHMRDVHRIKQERGVVVNHAGIETMKHFTWENSARALISAVS